MPLPELADFLGEYQRLAPQSRDGLADDIRGLIEEDLAGGDAALFRDPQVVGALGKPLKYALTHTRGKEDRKRRGAKGVAG